MKGGAAGRALAGALLVSLLSGTDAGATAAARGPVRVATRVPRFAGKYNPRAPSITLSDGWGCATFDSELGKIHQCWDAGPHPRAFSVPWLRDRMDYAHDHVCEHDVPGMTYRCWHRPRRGDVQPRAMPASWQWLNPHGAGWDDVYSRSDRLENVFPGGTFACLRTTKNNRVFCLGDDRYGQLGSSTPPRPDTGADDPAWVRGVGPEVSPALGTWHACGLEVPAGGREEPIPVLCWGRGDHGQLGAPAPDACVVDGHSIPCARTPVRGPRVRDQEAVLGLGDLFTCVTSQDGTKCWGANRDGLFGVRGSCPASLRRAWPTPDGPVPAPHASCTTTPVALPGAKEFDPNFTIEPRRICYDGAGDDGCLSAVPKPRDRKIKFYTVSPGSDASACALRGDRVICWGEKYSPPGALDRPVTVALEPLPPPGDMAIIGSTNPTGWKPKCQIHNPCQALTRKFPRCRGGDKEARPASDILAAAPSLAGKVVRARGRLAVGELAPLRLLRSFQGPGCDPRVACCQDLAAPIGLGAGGGLLGIAGTWCRGDESRACCNAAAYGQTVVATGRLEHPRDAREARDNGLAEWQLADVSVCEEGRAANR